MGMCMSFDFLCSPCLQLHFTKSYAPDRVRHDGPEFTILDDFHVLQPGTMSELAPRVTPAVTWLAVYRWLKIVIPRRQTSAQFEEEHRRSLLGRPRRTTIMYDLGLVELDFLQIVLSEFDETWWPVSKYMCLETCKGALPHIHLVRSW